MSCKEEEGSANGDLGHKPWIKLSCILFQYLKGTRNLRSINFFKIFNLEVFLCFGIL